MLRKLKFPLFLSTALLSTVACSTLKETKQTTATKATNATSIQVVAEDTLHANTKPFHAAPEVIKDSLDFLKEHVVDVRTDLEDEVQPHFNNNLDSLVHLWYIQNRAEQYGEINEHTQIQLKTLSDSLYIKRLQELPSAIDLSYNNIVKNYIKLYTQKRKNQVELMLGLSEYYFPIFEEILDKEGLPQELKYLPIIESALNPRALSRAGASGLWQFMYGTGRMYKLKSNSFVDERRDPIKASYAAARFLKDLYKIYGNWQLVIAAYNCGPGNVNKAIRRSGGKRNYWDIYYRLPKETRGYVPAFIAAVYTFNYHKEHGLKVRKSKFPIVTDTIMVAQVLHFDQVSKVLNISRQQLRELNPQYRADIVPAHQRPYSLKLPIEFTSNFIDLQDSIFNYKKEYYFNLKDKVVNPRDRYQKYAHAAPKNRAKVYYKVKSGDAVGLIASWFHIRTSNLRYWNNINRNLIKVGQNLVIYVPKNQAGYYRKFNTKSYAQKQASLGKKPVNTAARAQSAPVKYDSRYVYHTVRRGENLWTIARKFPGVSNTDIMRMNNIRNAKNLKVGQKLKIKQKG